MNPTDADRADIPWLDAQHFENRRNFPPEELSKYDGQYIAWSWDGSRIHASAPERDELWDKLVAMGVDPHRVVFEWFELA
jgi:hypothetical protein